MPNQRRRRLCRGVRGAWIIAVAFLVATAATAQKQSENPYYARVNTLGFFSAYSNDSSHILLGDVENRKLLFVGASYSRRLVLNRTINFQYNGEFMPLALESDPIDHFDLTWNAPAPVPPIDVIAIPYAACHSLSGSGSDVFNGIVYGFNYTNKCGRRWTAGEAMSPAGLQLNFLPRHRSQLFFIGHGGYIYSTRAIPVENAGAFNFTFDAGVGFEFYLSKTRSIRAEYRYHHLSNKNTADANPGVDNGLLQVTYSFGR